MIVPEPLVREAGVEHSKLPPMLKPDSPNAEVWNGYPKAPIQLSPKMLTLLRRTSPLLTAGTITLGP